jgi:hypothetical protein
MATAIVGGALANKPFNGGEAWVRLAWILGLQRLGFEVYFVEELASAACVDAAGEPAEFDASANRAYFESVVRDFGFEGRAGLLCDGGDRGSGLGLGELTEIAAQADVLFNVSGNLELEELLGRPGATVYVDLDPGFTQAWHADRSVPFRIAEHDHYATVGLNVGTTECPVPACGLEWIATLPPVPIDEWPARPQPPGPLRFTTVATWRSPYGALEVGGRTMGLKHHQFRRLIELPERVDDVIFELALDIEEGDSADRDALLEHGWRLVDPREVAGTPRAFRDYVGGSSAEFSVAQGVYTETASGWFSDRTGAYLASGRPAVVQDTGIGEMLPPNEGLLTFYTLEQAVTAVERVVAQRERQESAAREWAVGHLNSDVVLGRLLSSVGVAG